MLKKKFHLSFWTKKNQTKTQTFVECSGCFLLDLLIFTNYDLEKLHFVSILPFWLLSYVFFNLFYFSVSQKVEVTETTHILQF